MERRWGVLGRLMRWLTVRRAAVVLPLLTVTGGCMLGLSVLIEAGQPLPPLALPEEMITPHPQEELPTPNPGPAPIGHEPTAVPLPTPTPAPSDDEQNILLLGTDHRPGQDPSWRTDTIVIVAIRPQAETVALFSVPRDLWVDIPGYGPGRINVADYVGERLYGPGGGPRLLAATLQQNLGIPVHAYARVNFDGLERIVDAVGGVTIDVDHHYDEMMDKDTPYLWHFRLAPGEQRLNGRLALGYVRSRRNSSDLDRCRRQQQLLLALRDAALRPAILPQIPRLLSALSDAVDTDLSAGRILSLVALAAKIDPSSYRTAVFDATMVRDWITPDGAMVLLPDRPRIRQVWLELTAPE